MNWVPLHLHSHMGIAGDCISRPKDIARRVADLGYDACALTDHGSISGAIQFSKAMKAKDIKPLLGIEFYICDKPAHIKQNNPNSHHLCVIAKNLKGFKGLIKAVTAANQIDNYYRRPRLSLAELAYFIEDNCVVFSGHMGSNFYNNIDNIEQEIMLFKHLFGPENVFVEIQLIDRDNLSGVQSKADRLREAAISTQTKCIATGDSHYCTREDAQDQRILLSSSLKISLNQINRMISRGQEVGMGGFFKSNNYHIPSLDELTLLHTEDEIQNTHLIAEMCEEYNILSPPRPPSFSCPNGLSNDEYLWKLCEDGLRTKKLGDYDYRSRLNMEMEVIEKNGLSGYFLIVQDYVKWAQQKYLTGVGRGSAGGCLVSYLTGITKLDPLPDGLLFERFYNEGRNTPGNIAFPDIDVDFPKGGREAVIQYIKDKYGHDCVAPIMTYQKIKGRGAVTDVLRAHEACSFDEIKNITKHIPGEAEISDQLSEMEDPSIIRWALEHVSDLSEWSEQYKRYFDQAIRLEGVNRSMGRHPSGIIISNDNLDEICPMANVGGEIVCAMEMGDIEAVGLLKFDILGTTVLNKLQGIGEMLKCKF